MKKRAKRRIKDAWEYLSVCMDPLLVLIQSIVPFAVSGMSDAQEDGASWIQIGISILLGVIALGNTVYRYIMQKTHRKNERSRIILSHLNQLHDMKAELIRDSTYHLEKENINYPLFYGVHGYIRNVCKNLRDTIARTIDTESEYVDVALIYKHKDSKNWKWLSGKSGTSAAKELNKFVKEATLFNYVISEKQIVFENEKKNCKFYVMKRRDMFFKNKGSVMAMPLTYFNNENGLIDLVLVISTYGVHFVDPPKKKEAEEFREFLIYEILPYYISLLQTEFGLMHIRHVYKYTLLKTCECRQERNRIKRMQEPFRARRYKGIQGRLWQGKNIR